MQIAQIILHVDHSVALVDNKIHEINRQCLSRAVFVRFSLGGGSEFRLAMTDRATIAGIEVAKLVPWNSLLN